MDDSRTKIFMLVDGERREHDFVKRLFSLYDLDLEYEIVTYNSKIYSLYNEMFVYNDPEDMDLLQVLKSRERNPDKKAIFDEAYSDILLVFDLDPQDPEYTPEKIKRMTAYFTESTDVGKLYLNYPMIESFYHMQAIPDPLYDGRYALLAELRAKTYKKRVGMENRDHDYRKFARTKAECSTVIRQNLNKACDLIHEEHQFIVEQEKVLLAQLTLLDSEEKVAVLNTCVFFISEYDSGLIADSLV